jgi:hypothetical protein
MDAAQTNTALQIGIIRHVRYGMTDRGGRPALQFSVYTDEGYAADHALFGAEAEQVFIDADVTDVARLDGHACWVDTSTHGIMRFVRIAKL